MRRRHRVLWGFSLGVVVTPEGDRLAENTIATIQQVEVFLNNAKEAGRPYTAILFTGGIFEKDKGQTTAVSELMRDAIGPKDIPVYIGTNSAITRQDITDGIEVLAEYGITLENADIDVVSEFWHTLGIAMLFLRRFGYRVGRVSSGYKISFKEIAGRIARLAYYAYDPEGKGDQATAVATRRCGR
ncbi:MAG TPA: hypothetical protein VGE59_01415 [Patescibacteria group bacterium]